MKRLIALAILAVAFMGSTMTASDVPFPTCFPCGPEQTGN
jgi:hypothetical protein